MLKIGSDLIMRPVASGSALPRGKAGLVFLRQNKAEEDKVTSGLLKEELPSFRPCFSGARRSKTPTGGKGGEVKGANWDRDLWATEIIEMPF
jgi:hypothetical protein